MAKKKEEKKKKEETPLKEPILKTTGANKIVDAFQGARKAKETAEAVKIEQMNMKRPRFLDDPGAETMAAASARKKREEEERKKMAKKLRE